MKSSHILSASAALAAASVISSAIAAPNEACQARSPATLTPVVELYTSEGCSSCPPADRWLSALKDDAAKGRVVAQAFHVGYWDYIGWADRFASPPCGVRWFLLLLFFLFSRLLLPSRARCPPAPP